MLKTPHTLRDTALVSRLKMLAPKTFEHFRKTYLPKHFRYWQEYCDDNTIWFCEMQEQAQIGYLLHYAYDIRKVNLNTFVYISNPGLRRKKGNILRQIINIFIQLEDENSPF
jgi:hypothetical protein